MAVEDIVAQYQAAGITSEEILADNEGLRKTIGRGLNGVGECEPPLRAIAQQLLKARRVVQASR